MESIRLTRRGKIVGAVLAGLFVVGCASNIATPDVGPGDGPWRYCVTPDDPERAKTGSLDCYLTGDVPEGKSIVWSGYESNVPHPKPERSPR